MTYTPKPGDKVTSPLLVGEWEVSDVGLEAGCRLVNFHGVAYLSPRFLTPVAPPLPPEPAVGEVVWARGRYWLSSDSFNPLPLVWIADARTIESWADIAADAEPVVPVSRVAEWITADQPLGHAGAARFLAEFLGHQ